MIDPIALMLGEWSYTDGVESIMFRIALSVVLSAIIGYERSTKRHAAGLRTFILVSLATTIAMLLDIHSGGGVLLLSAASVIGVAIITCNSILFSSRSQIKGLTTSVGLWACGIIGLTAGAGYYTVTLVSFAALFCILLFFPPIEGYLKNRSNHFEVHLELISSAHLQSFVTTIRRLGLRIDDIEANPAYVGSGLSVYSIAISISSAELKKYKTHNEIIEALSTLDYVYHIERMSM